MKVETRTQEKRGRDGVLGEGLPESGKKGRRQGEGQRKRAWGLEWVGVEQCWEGRRGFGIGSGAQGTTFSKGHRGIGRT